MPVSHSGPICEVILFKSYCLSLYGCSLWSLSSSSLSIIEVALNKLLRELWHLPQNSHSAVVHCVAQIDTISSFVLSRFHSLLYSSLSSPSPLVKSVFYVSSQVAYSFAGHKNIYGSMHINGFSSPNFIIANIICNIRHDYGLHSPLNA